MNKATHNRIHMHKSYDIENENKHEKEEISFDKHLCKWSVNVFIFFFCVATKNLKKKINLFTQNFKNDEMFNFHALNFRCLCVNDPRFNVYVFFKICRLFFCSIQLNSLRLVEIISTDKHSHPLLCWSFWQTQFLLNLSIEW